MKSLGVILSIIAILAVLPLYYFKFSGEEMSNANTKAADNIKQQEAKIAYVNFDTLLQNYKFYDDISVEFQSKRDKASKQLETRGQKLESEVVSFQRRAQANLLSQNEFNRLQQELAQKQQDLQVYQQTVSAGLLEEEQAKNKELYDKIHSYLKKYNEAKGFNMIFNYREGDAIWLAEDGLDITNDIVEGLNKEYEAENKEE